MSGRQGVCVRRGGRAGRRHDWERRDEGGDILIEDS